MTGVGSVRTGKRSLHPRTLLAAVAVASLVVACASSGPAGAYRDDAVGLLIVEESLRPFAPSVEATTLDGRVVQSGAFLGEAVTISSVGGDFALRESQLPALHRLAAANSGVQVLMVDIDRAAAALRSFGFDVRPDHPVTMLIDSHGRLAGRILGLATQSSLAAVVANLS